MKRGAQVAFGLSALFLCFFVFGITDAGQVGLRGRIPQNATHWQLDDIYMGAGLTPWVYGLVPSILLAFIGGGMACSHSSFSGFNRFAALSIAVALGAWVVGYAYFVKIAGYPAVGFFTFKMAAGLLTVSFILCGLFRLRGFFK